MALDEEARTDLAYFMQGLILIFIIIAVKNENYAGILNGLMAFIIMSIPFLLKRKWNVTLPWTLNFLIVLTLFLHVGGVVGGWYRTLHPFYYDKFMHVLASATVALLGFASVLIIDKYTKIKLTEKSIIFFVVVFAMAVGGLWEIVEFVSDTFFGTNAQYDGLNGTMLDLIFDLLGGLLVGIVGFFKLRKGKEKFLDSLLKEIGLSRIRR